MRSERQVADLTHTQEKMVQAENKYKDPRVILYTGRMARSWTDTME
jgi:hypothetical protein